MISTNCDPDIAVHGVTARCPRCGQWHLRPGYCQALDPTSYWHVSPLGQKWKAAHPDLSTSVDRPVDKRVDIALVVDTVPVDKPPRVDKSVDKPASVDTASVDKSTNVDKSVDTADALVDRLAYQREWIRRKRAAEPSE